MNTQAIPLLCGAALAIMCGAVASHYAAVDQMVDLARLNRTPLQSPAALPAADSQTLALIAELQKQNASLRDMLQHREASPAAPGPLPSGPTEETLRAFLAELIEQNRGLRDQIAEANRDIMELQFRADTLSEQFRPLNATQTTDILDSEELISTEDLRDDIGVLPPLDLP